MSGSVKSQILLVFPEDLQMVVDMSRQFTAIIEREDDGYVSLCPELDIASQGTSIEEARANLKEAIELFFDCASEEEIERRVGGEVYVSVMEVEIGQAG
jgi:predicted RNase H-like HicB family nuclease